MNDNLKAKLSKLGYKDLELESLFDELPKNIWVTLSKKKIEQQECYFILKIKGKKYTLMLCVDDPEEEAVVLDKETSTSLKEAVAKMLVFLAQSDLTSPTTE